MRQKATIFDYLDWRGDLPLDFAAFNEIDGLILSMMSFVDFSHSGGDVTETDMAEGVDVYLSLPREERHLGAIIPDGIFDMSAAAAHCVRYRDTKVSGFTNVIDRDENEQFAAVTFYLPDGSLFVAFRGTDDTLAGWKEDMLLGLKSGVRAQVRAADYLKKAAGEYPDIPIRVGGHSKGGNLAVWAAVNADESVRERIIKAYSFDGPGFLQDFIGSERYTSFEDRIITYIPDSSIVGAFLEHGGETVIIESTRTGILQHDPYSWVVNVSGFVTKGARSPLGKRSDKAINAWISSMDESEKHEFVKTLFYVLDATGANTLTDVRNNPIKTFAAAQRAINSLDKEKRDKWNSLMLRILNLKP